MHSSSTSTNLVFRGCNVNVQSGSGSTAGTVNGYGNLIVGYNEAPASPSRGGSHNLIVGPKHNFSSYGGLAAGYESTVSGTYATVSGGNLNTASGDYASVSAGTTNLASGNYSSVSGGDTNTARQVATSVSGGQSNIAGTTTANVGEDANVSGGGKAIPPAATTRA